MIVNGTNMKHTENMTISKLLTKLDLDKEKVVVEINFKIIIKEDFDERIINEDDKIEIVGFIGGG